MIKYKAIYFLRNERVFKALYELLALEKYSPELLSKYKEQKIDNLVSFAKDSISFYKDCSSVSDNILSFPIVDKLVLRTNMISFTPQNTSVSWRSTSGTTGTPFVFIKDKNATAYMDAMMYLVYSWHGISIGDKQARLWGRPLKTKGRIQQCIKDLILNRIRLSAFEMNYASCRKFYDKLLYFKPKYFYSYSNALYQFALFIEKNSFDGRMLKIKIAICTGEVLFDYQREKISQVFGCTVVNEYGSTENGIIGFECQYGKMHVVPTVHLEIFNPDEKGFGEIVVTELNSRALPFIRYKNGDIGRLLDDKCKCGKPYQLLEIREGRVDDYIMCPDGSLVYDAILAYTLKNDVEKFKAVQEVINHITISIVPKSGYCITKELVLIDQLRKYLGNEMEIDINVVEDILPEKSGKLRYFVSKVRQP